jgi:hypothetical protein
VIASSPAFAQSLELRRGGLSVGGFSFLTFLKRCWLPDPRGLGPGEHQHEDASARFVRSPIKPAAEPDRLSDKHFTDRPRFGPRHCAACKERLRKRREVPNAGVLSASTGPTSTRNSFSRFQFSGEETSASACSMRPRIAGPICASSRSILSLAAQWPDPCIQCRSGSARRTAQRRGKNAD